MNRLQAAMFRCIRLAGESPEGGGAFPFSATAPSGADVDWPGMSLRDWFAGQALAGQMAYEGAEGCGGEHGAANVATWCYELADAMLAERARGKQP